MSSLKDRKNKQINPVENTILKMTSTEVKAVKEPKKKYAVNVVFDGKLEELIRNRAEQKGVGVATYIKMLVNEDLNK